MATECAHGQLARSCEICERDNTIATLRQEIRLMHEDARAKEARIAELERELMAISQDDGKVERALARANERIAELEKALREITALDYANAATNGAAYGAVQIARRALRGRCGGW